MNKKLWCLFFVVFGLTLSGCKKDQAKVETAKDGVQPAKKSEQKKNINAAYTPDFNFDVLYVDYDPTEDQGEFEEIVSEEGGVQSESVIPGVRKLSQYKTKYATSRLDVATVSSLTPITEADKKETESVTTTKKKSKNKKGSDDSKEEFFIEEWGPIGTVISESQNPSFYVVFSKPVKPLKALEVPTDTSEYMKIEPKIKGVFRWYGNQHLSFEASEPANPSVEYVITVPENVKSLEGDSLSGEHVFKTQATPIDIIQFYPGYIEESEYSYNETSGAVPPLDKTFFIRLNYAIPSADFNKVVTAKVASTNAEIKLSAEPVYSSKYLFSWSTRKTIFDEARKTTNTFIVTCQSDLPKNDNIIVTASVGKDSISKNFSTLKPFSVRNVEKYTKYSGLHKFPLSITFNQIPDIKTAAESISFDFNCELTEDNFSVSGKTLTVYDLPITYDETHVITIKPTLKDVYGQSLSVGAESYKFKTLSPKAYLKYPDTGFNILEAQFEPKYLFEYQNVNEGSYYKVSATDRPLYMQPTGMPSDAPKIELKQEKDTRLFEEIDLTPFLKNGYGTVRFDDRISYQEYSSWREEFYTVESKAVTTIQVTDLGVTTRIGINKAVVLVSSLKTGEPVAGANVYLCTYSEEARKSDLKNNYLIGQGVTDEGGLCVINFNEKERQKLENAYYSYYSTLMLVEKGDDSVLFRPNTHSNYGANIYSRNPYYARNEYPKTFMFVDRGIYKPGETVTFRGIDRNLKEGVLSINHGSYNIEVEENRWDVDNIIAKLRGNLSDSGGFYGSFKIPDDAPTGSYRLTYFRQSDNSRQYIYFTVAEFERLKYETSISVPSVTYYSGDKLSANLTASYLAGGPLGGADYQVDWYCEPAYFNPTTPETKGFRFGGGNSSYSRDLISQETGKLNGEGKASVSLKSEKVVDGRPYEYRISSTITDISNQRISASNTIMVHPSLFYAGLSKPKNITGFAKKGDKLQFPYILVNTKGEQLGEAAMKTVQSLSYTLTREEWVVAHEQSVYNSIYTRYTRKDVVEQEGVIKPASKGEFTITPKATGWYTLELRGVDKNGSPTITTYGFYVTGGNSYWYNDNNGQFITLTPDQTLYNPGETAQILMESALPSGDYLITVEREGIFTEEVRHFDSPANVIEVPIAANYVPVVYVAVSSYSVRTEAPDYQYGEVDLDKPKGYFGVTAVYVNPDVKSFKVEVTCDKPSYRPGDDCTVTLKATRGGVPFPNAELTLMAVDRGVIDLINYHVPNPIDFFYSESNYPLYVVGGDDRYYLMDPITYSIKDLVGGDAEEGEDEKEDERKDFRPTAVFEPCLKTGQDGTVSCTFKMPDSLTTYRITVFGVQDDLFALQEDEVKVQNPINITQVQPRKLRIRDTAECGVLITNLSEKAQNVTVSLEVRSPIGNTVQDEQEGRVTIPGTGFVDGDNTHTVKVESNSSSVVYFDVAAETAGTVELVYTVRSEILNEKIISPIKIEETFVYETVTMTSSTSDSQNEAIILPGFAKQNGSTLKFTLDATHLGPLSSAIQYLFDYPYGCLEQQSTAILPLLIFEDYINVFGIDKRVSNIHQCVKSTMKSWTSSQLANGGFPYWPGSYYDSISVSARIAHIYAIGKQHGYTDKELGIDIYRLCNYLKSGRYYDCLPMEKAYISYVLALNGDPSAAKMLNALKEDINQLNNVALSYTGLGFYQLGMIDEAKAMSVELRKYIQSSERSVSMISRECDYFDLWYSSDVSKLALALQLYVSLNPDDPLVDRLIFTTLKEKSAKGYWNNTCDTSKVLEAVYAYIKQRNLDGLNFTADAKFNGTQVIDGSFKGVAAKPVTKEYNFTDSVISGAGFDKEIPVQFEKSGEGELYYTVEMRYALPDEILTGRDEGIGLEYQIFDVETGDELNLHNTVVELKSGKTYKAVVKISSPKNRTYIAMRTPIPSGAEILDSTFVTTGEGGGITQIPENWRQALSNKNIYDNEIQFFWNSFGSGATSIEFTFRASRRGIYPTPPVQAECMYEPEIFGRTDGNLYIIK